MVYPRNLICLHKHGMLLFSWHFLSWNHQNLQKLDFKMDVCNEWKPFIYLFFILGRKKNVNVETFTVWRDMRPQTWGKKGRKMWICWKQIVWFDWQRLMVVLGACDARSYECVCVSLSNSCMVACQTAKQQTIECCQKLLRAVGVIWNFKREILNFWAI